MNIKSALSLPMNISEASRLWLEFVKEGREWCDFPGKKEIVSQLTEQGKHFVLLFPKQRKQPMLHGISLCLQTKPNQMPLNIQDARCPLDQSWSNGWCVNLARPNPAQLAKWVPPLLCHSPFWWPSTTHSNLWSYFICTFLFSFSFNVV